MCNHCRVLSEDEMNALLNEHPTLSQYGPVYRIVEHDDCYDVYPDQDVEHPGRGRNHVFVFDKPLLNEY